MSVAVREEILAEARALWGARELTFPKFVRQTWEQGTWLAKEAAVAQIMKDREARLL